MPDLNGPETPSEGPQEVAGGVMWSSSPSD